MHQRNINLLSQLSFFVAVLILTGPLEGIAQETKRSAFAQKMEKVKLFFAEVDTIAKLAYRYRTTPVEQRGGGGSYVGFKVPAGLESTGVGNYSIWDVQANEIVILAYSKVENGNYYAVYDAAGRHKAEDFAPTWKNYDDVIKHTNAIVQDVLGIKAYAMNWRELRAAGKDGSFLGFAIPDFLASTRNATYTLVELRKDTVYVKAVSAIGMGFCYFRITSNNQQRRLVQGEYRPGK